jgi:MPBQ/MSBQ methyltransferase
MRVKRPADFILRFCTDVVHLDSLHFGLWDIDHARTIDGLKQAQRNYSLFLIDKIPAGVSRILDAGCGTGELSGWLIERGYAVTALTPDVHLTDIVTRRLKDIGTVVLSKFEDFYASQKYDLIIMSESCQYMSRRLMFPKARELLTDDGLLLVSDYFRKAPTKYYETVWTNAEFSEKLAQSAFDVVSCDDITERTLPTLDVARTCYAEVVLPTIELLRDLLLHVTPPIVVWAFTRALRKQFRLLGEFLYAKQLAQFDSSRFKEHVEYKVFLLRRL